MQIFYNHSIKKQQGVAKHHSDPESHGRVVIVFREGVQKSFVTDSGTELLSLLPLPRALPIFGAINGLKVLHSYTRQKLREMRAHRYV
jgi:hypothetical protein